MGESDSEYAMDLEEWMADRTDNVMFGIFSGNRGREAVLLLYYSQ